MTRSHPIAATLPLIAALCAGCALGHEKEVSEDVPRSTAQAQVHTRVTPGDIPAEAGSAPLEDPGAEQPIAVTRLIARLVPTDGHRASGTLAFTAHPQKGLTIEGEFEGLPPGDHGFHIHQFGDCSGPDGKTAGTHFNLKGSSESPPKDTQRITGNLGELVAGADGRARISTTVEAARIDGPYGVIGRAVVVHARGNDPSAPPMGDAGGRLACGVIGIARAPR